MFSDWLAEELDQRGWSHSELARRARVSQVSVSGVISGSRKPGCEFCIKIAQALELSPVFLLVQAGILPTSPGSENDPLLSKIHDKLKNLSIRQRKEVLRFMRYLSQDNTEE
jgi:transcriptional regulator with XRE-family HTH domain